MSYMLPTRNHSNRIRTVTFNPHVVRSSHECTRELTCPYCYRDRIRMYGRQVRLPVSRPTYRQRQRPMQRLPPTYLPSLYTNMMGIRLPGQSIVVKNSDETCAICLTDYTAKIQGQRLPCSHIFHVDCLVKWCRRKKTCPMCRKKL